MKLIAATLAAVTTAQFDGNPHGWGRVRRCDHFQYDPPCGACEGVGGLVTSDDDDGFTATSCEIVAEQPDPATLMPPKWAPNFHMTSHEILIGKKSDPNCFQAFPWNDSVGEHCYKPQEVELYSDLGGADAKKAIFLLANQAGNLGVDGNVSSAIIHQGPNMWIVNNITNHGSTSMLTICTQPAEGGDHSKPGVEPVQYNWTGNLMFVAREKIGVEYLWNEQVLDHWAFGPHHAWVEPETGLWVRMWQPFNGLQVLEPGSWNEGAQDPGIFEDLTRDGSTAPKEGRVDGPSDFRIKCTDDGFYTGPSELAASDLKRARTKVPRSEYQGDDFESMSTNLNKWLLKHAPNSQECDTWTVEELQQLQLTLHRLRDSKLDEVYQSSQDNRRMQVPEDMAKEWAELNALAATDPELARIRRDGHCHEAVMWYVHHLPESVKVELKDKLALPLLSYNKHHVSDASHPVLKAYEEQVTCQSCHAKVSPDDVVVV